MQDGVGPVEFLCHLQSLIEQQELPDPDNTLNKVKDNYEAHQDYVNTAGRAGEKRLCDHQTYKDQDHRNGRWQIGPGKCIVNGLQIIHSSKETPCKLYEKADQQIGQNAIEHPYTYQKQCRGKKHLATANVKVASRFQDNMHVQNALAAEKKQAAPPVDLF